MSHLHHGRDGDPAREPAGATLDTWQGRATNRGQWLPALAGAGCLALGIVLAVRSVWSGDDAGLIASVIGCIAAGLIVLFGTLAFLHVSVTFDGDHLTVRCGPVGVPRRRIPLSDVVAADYVPRITPRHWGGWGYRWRPEQGTAVVVRQGEGLLLRLGDGHVFTVTVDDAEAAVMLIRRRLLAASRPTG